MNQDAVELQPYLNDVVLQGAANKLALTAGTLEQFKQMTYESLSNINGIGEATVLGIVDYLQTNTDITDLQSLGVTPI